MPTWAPTMFGRLISSQSGFRPPSTRRRRTAGRRRRAPASAAPSARASSALCRSEALQPSTIAHSSRSSVAGEAGVGSPPVRRRRPPAGSCGRSASAPSAGGRCGRATKSGDRRHRRPEVPGHAPARGRPRRPPAGERISAGLAPRVRHQADAGDDHPAALASDRSGGGHAASRASVAKSCAAQARRRDGGEYIAPRRVAPLRRPRRAGGLAAAGAPRAAGCGSPSLLAAASGGTPRPAAAAPRAERTAARAARGLGGRDGRRLGAGRDTGRRAIPETGWCSPPVTPTGSPPASVSPPSCRPSSR